MLWKWKVFIQGQFSTSDKFCQESHILSFIIQILSKQLGIVCIILILSFGHCVVILIVKDCFNAYILLPEAVKLLRHYCNKF